MSDNWLILIPKSPAYIPSKAAQKRAVAFFRRIAPAADDIGVESSDRPRLVDCGGNLEKISCPNCGQELEFDWWEDWVSNEADQDFPLRPATLPCCAEVRSLTDLRYDWPQGFARFSLEAMNPGIGDPADDTVREFEKILGCDLLKIWRHL